MTPLPIFVTGAHRSGSSWVGEMLSASRQAAYVHEPFNLIVRPGWTPRPLPHWYLYVTEENAATYRAAVEPAFRLRYPVRGRGPLTPRGMGVVAVRAAQSALARRRRRRPLVKDPLALFSTEWLVSTFGAVPVVLVRHPAAFASSLARLDWRFDFTNWLDQPLLVRDHLGPFVDDIRAHMKRSEAGEADLIDEAALMWRVIYATVATFRRRHADWIFRRHEDLSARPAEEFAALYEHLGLTWNGRAERAVTRSTTGSRAEGRPGTVAPSRRDSTAVTRLWASRLEPAAVDRLRAAVDDVASAFYSDDDW